MSTIKSDNSDLTINASGTSKDIKFQADGTERMVLKSDGKLGVGVTPDRELTVGGVSNARINILSNASSLGASQLMFGDPADSQVGRVYYDHDDNSMRFHTNASERLRIDSDGNVNINETGTPYPIARFHVKTVTAGRYAASFRHDGNADTDLGIAIVCGKNTGSSGVVAVQFKDGDGSDVGKIYHTGTGTYYNTGNSGGIDFSLAGSDGSGMTSEILDDYEEGTWSPAMKDNAGVTAGGSHSGYYTKIGRWVHFEFYLSSLTFSGMYGGNEAKIYGFPFSVTGSSYAPCSSSAGSMAVNAGSAVIFQIFPGTTYGTFYKNNWNTSSHSSIKINEFGTSTWVRCSGSYFV